MNVYMLKSRFSAESLGSPADAKQQTENAFRGALKGTPLVNEFSRVSEPNETTGLMAVVCSEEAAVALRQQSETLGIESLVIDQGRTDRLKKIQPMLEQNTGAYAARLALVARI